MYISKGKINRFLYKKLKLYFNLFLHYGIKYKCPFCNYSSRDLSIIGEDISVLKEKNVIGGGLRNGGCFKCGSTDRERLIYLYLMKKAQIFRSDNKISILHIAPENSISKRLSEFGFQKYICGDLFPESYNNLHTPVQKIDILKIPYDNNVFDLIICNHVLEHIPNDIAALTEIRRVLKNTGQAILQVPISKNQYETIEDASITDSKQKEIFFGQADHIRIYGQDYVKRLEISGFKVNRINISKEFMKYGVNEYEDIFVCTKN